MEFNNKLRPEIKQPSAYDQAIDEVISKGELLLAKKKELKAEEIADLLFAATAKYKLNDDDKMTLLDEAMVSLGVNSPNADEYSEAKYANKYAKIDNFFWSRQKELQHNALVKARKEAKKAEKWKQIKPENISTLPTPLDKYQK